MKRLKIRLAGNSPLLALLETELDSHGHSVERLVATTLPAFSDVLIEDGTQPFSPAQLRDLAEHPLSLRVAWLDGVPHLCIAGARELPAAPCEARLGSTQLHTWMAAWVDELALLVASLARDDYALADAGPLHTAPLQPLSALQQVAWESPWDGPVEPTLLAAAAEAFNGRLWGALAEHGECTALRVGSDCLSYRALAALAQGVRAQLPAYEGRPLVIGLCAQRSTLLYAAVLAILAEGHVYLPIDPALPQERQRFMLEDAGAALLLHDGSGSAQVYTCETALLCSQPSPPQPASTLTPEAPCLCLYTSGTTGKPKGVLLSQANLGHFAAWYAGHVALGTSSRVLQFSTLSFDSSLIDIFPTWLSGATLVVPNEQQRGDPYALAALVRQEALTHAFLPPALLGILPLEGALGLQHITTGGDVCEPRVIAALATQCHFHNLYGPTEATVLVTARQFSPGTANFSLGGAIANSRVLLLGEDGQPVQEGERGELYIAGPGVALGYLNRPELTAERYVQLPLPAGESLRAYRTGDLARWGAEGVELCGRRDLQVKIRGQRVEPEEIERCLQACQAAPQLAVVIDARKRILVFHTGAPGCEAALRREAQQHLPAYMHPSAYHTLAALPAATNGKVDRAALLAMALPTAARATGDIADGPLEELLVELWAELLALSADEISTSDSFFQLGGHSILMSQLLLGIRERLGRSVPINRFIEVPTIRRLAQLLDGNAGPGNGGLEGLEADVAAPFGFSTLPPEPGPHRALLTGANGFLGVHIAQALLQAGYEEVVCLVRAPTYEQAVARFEQAVMDNHIDGMDPQRLVIVPAQLGIPTLGLSPAQFDSMAKRIGVVIHSAANVNHALDYPALRADNVLPLEALLAFCETGRKKVFNYVSTLSACSAQNAEGWVLETAAVATPPLYLRNGYNLSKWAAERRLERARQLGCAVNVLRPGNIGFNSTTGVCQAERNRLLLMLKGSLQMALVPELELQFDLMPVDFLARFIAGKAQRYDASRCVFNLHNPQPLAWQGYLAAWRSAGYVFETVPVPQWQAALATITPDNALFNVVGFYLDGFEEDIGDISRIHYHNAEAAINDLALTYPAKTPALLARGCHYLQTNGFMPNPTRRTTMALQPDTRVANPQGPRVVSRVAVGAAPDQVWKMVGNFAGFAEFVTAVSHTEMTGDGPGAVRKKFFKDGNMVVEQLNSYDNDALCMTWSLIHTTLPVGNLWAAMQVAPTAEGCDAIWTIQADPPEADADLVAFEAFLQGFADQAMEVVRQRFM